MDLSSDLIKEKATIFRPWERSPTKNLSTVHDTKKSPIPKTERPEPRFVTQMPDNMMILDYRIPTTDQADLVPTDSGYDSDRDSSSSPVSHHRQRPYLTPRSINLMERWYQDNRQHPYPSSEVVKYMSDIGGITVTQVRKWMANKRSRSYNTLSYNRTIHPKRLQRLQKEYRASVLTMMSRHHHQYVRVPSTPRMAQIPKSSPTHPTDAADVKREPLVQCNVRVLQPLVPHQLFK